MLNNKKLLIVIVGATCALAIALGAAVFASTRIARAQTEAFRAEPRMEFLDPATFDGELEAPPLPGPGFPGTGMAYAKGVENTDLAEALGITVDELQAAREAAWQNAIDQSLAQGLLTEAQAEWLKKDNFGKRGRGSWLLPWLAENDALKMDSFLAGELGITVEELQAARKTAAEASLQEAIDNEKISQEQADLVRARQALVGYIEPGTLEAQTLGMSLEELQAKRDDGIFIPDLIEEQGLTQEEFRSAVQAAYEQMINQAVSDGVITQAQADLLLSAGPGRGRPNFLPGGPGRRHP